MGCASSHGNEVYRLCYKAYQSDGPVDLAKLKEAAATLHPGEIDSPGDTGWTALNAVMLNKKLQPEVVTALLDLGADPWSASTPTDFSSSPLGMAIKFNMPSMLKPILDTFKGDVHLWRKLANGVRQVPKGTVGHNGAAPGIKVTVDGKRGRVEPHVLGTDGGNTAAGGGDSQQTMVKFEDGSIQGVLLSKLVVLPCAEKEVRQVMIDGASAAGVPDEVKELFLTLEEGSYGQTPSKDLLFGGV